MKCSNKGVVTISYLVGKSLCGNRVFVSPRHQKFDLSFSFKNEAEAKNYYDFLDYENKKMFKQRIKILFCKHKNEHNLDVGSKIFHYLYCPNCERAIYVNDETTEDREKRISAFRKRIKEEEIKELEQEIIYKQEKLLKLKDEFAEYHDN